jgi:hypothetical protein
MSNTYRVKPGDSLWKIARLHYGNGNLWTMLAEQNGLTKPDLLLAGQIITLPYVTSQWRVNPRDPTEALKTPVWKNAPTVAHPAFECDLGEYFKPRPNSPAPASGMTLTLHLSGKLKMQRRGVLESFTAADFSQISLRSRQESVSALGDLIDDMAASFDHKTGVPSISGGLISELKAPPGAKVVPNVFSERGRIIYRVDPAPVLGNYRGIVWDGTFGYQLNCDIANETESPIPQCSQMTIPFRILVSAAMLTPVSVVIRQAIPSAALAEGVIAFTDAYESLRRAGLTMPSLIY